MLNGTFPNSSPENDDKNLSFHEPHDRNKPVCPTSWSENAEESIVLAAVILGKPHMGTLLESGRHTTDLPFDRGWRLQ